MQKINDFSTKSHLNKNVSEVKKNTKLILVATIFKKKQKNQQPKVRISPNTIQQLVPKIKKEYATAILILKLQYYKL